MPSEIYEPTDRRPLASRNVRLWQNIAARLAAHRVSPNAISIAGMIVGIVAGLLLAATTLAQTATQERLLWIAAAAAIQLRLLANMLDGMVAIALNQASPLGELYNELPDRVSDIAIIIGAGYSVGGHPVLGFVAACLAVLTAYIRAVGKAAGASNLFVGPMAKPHRMFALTVVAVFMALLPRHWQFLDFANHRAGLPAIGLAIIIFGSALTIWRRLRLIVHHLQTSP